MRNLLVFCFVLLFSTSCSKNKAGNKVEIYVLSSYQLVAGKCKIDSLRVSLESLPLIKDEEIISYTKSNYDYQLTNEAFQKIKALKARTPIAVTIDREVIFYAIYMPLFLSSTCFESITFAESWYHPSGIVMNLGYPGFQASSDIDDQRNNAKLITTFIKQGKLR